MEKIMYRVTYANGATQTCRLISRQEYDSTIRVYREQINDCTSQMSGLSKNNKKYKELAQKCKELKEQISEYGDFFVSDSPLGKALFSSHYYNLELPPQQGGRHRVLFKMLNM